MNYYMKSYNIMVIFITYMVIFNYYDLKLTFIKLSKTYLLLQF